MYILTHLFHIINLYLNKLFPNFPSTNFTVQDASSTLLLCSCMGDEVLHLPLFINLLHSGIVQVNRPS